MTSGQTPETIGGWIAHWAERQPDAPAILEEGREPLSYRALAGICAQAQTALNARGYGRNDRIAFVHPGGSDFASAIAAIWGAATAVPLNPDYTEAEFTTYFETLRIDALLIPAGAKTPARGAAEKCSIPVLELVRSDPGVAGAVTLSGACSTRTALAGPAQADDTALLLCTSGTTSQPKIVPRSHTKLLNRIRTAIAENDLTPQDRCLAMMPLFHSSGLNNGFGVSIVSGGSAVIMATFDAASFFRQLERCEPTWYHAAPTFHRAIISAAPDHRDAIRASRLRLIRSATARLDPDLAADLARTFSVPVFVAYSSTEAGSISSILVRPGKTTVKPDSVGRPTVSDVVVLGDDGRPVAPGVRGEVAVRGPQVIDGYENDPEANAAAFTGGWFRTGDEGAFDDDGYLTLSGRIKEIINRGGEKVSPPEVEAVLATHHEVDRAVVFPIPHPTLGEEVAAAVVLKPWAGIDATHLTRLAQRNLVGFKVPRKIVFVDDIPTGPTGKVQRSRLAAAFGLDKPPDARTMNATEPERAPTPMEATLAAMWARALGLEHVRLDDDFFLLGGDSLQAVDLLLDIERELGRQLPGAILFEAGTVAELARRIEAEVPLGTVVAIQPEGDLPPFFCAPGRSENVLVFRALSQRLGAQQPVFGIRFGPLDDAGMPFLDLDDMADHCVAAMREVQPAGPYYLAGYSFGGRLVYAMAQRLRARGEEVALLAFFDTYCFSGRKRLGVRRRLGFNLAAMAEMGPVSASRFALVRAIALSSKQIRSIRRRLNASARRRFVAWRKQVPRFLADPEEIYLELDARAQLAPYDGRAVLFKAERTGRAPADAHDGWRDLIGERLEVVPTPGGHYDMLREPHIYVLVHELRARLRQAREQNRPALPTAALAEPGTR